MITVLFSTTLFAVAFAVSPARATGLPVCPDDWLVQPCPITTTATVTPTGPDSFNVTLSNGIIRRVVSVTPPYAATTSLYSYALGQEKLGKPIADASFVLSQAGSADEFVFVGGLPSSSAAAAAPGSRMTYAPGSMRTGAIPPLHAWQPGLRGSPRRAWPPGGLRLTLDFVLPCRDGSGGLVNASLHVDMFDQVAAFAQTLALTHTCRTPIGAYNMSVLMMTVASGVSQPEFLTDAAVATSSVVPEMDGQPGVFLNLFLPFSGFNSKAVTADFGPGIVNLSAADQPFLSYMVLVVAHDAPRLLATQYGMGR